MSRMSRVHPKKRWRKQEHYAAFGGIATPSRSRAASVRMCPPRRRMYDPREGSPAGYTLFRRQDKAGLYAAVLVLPGSRKNIINFLLCAEIASSMSQVSDRGHRDVSSHFVLHRRFVPLRPIHSYYRVAGILQRSSLRAVRNPSVGVAGPRV